MTRRAWGIAVLVAAGLAAGCGGDGGDQLSQEEYEQRMTEVGSNLEESFNDLGSSFNQGDGASLDEAADRIAAIQDSMREEADQLEDVEPPEDVQAEHDQLVEGLRGFADELDEFREAVDEGDVQAIQQFAQDFQDSDAAKKIEEAGEKIEEKGYDIGGN